MPYRQPSYAEQIWYILRFKLKEVLRMPYKPAHPCHWPGCGKLTHDRYCEEHTKQSNKNYEKYGRDPAVRRRYGRPWSRIRASYVKTHPFCEECFSRGIIVPVEEVHHKRRLPKAVRTTETISFRCAKAVMLASMRSVVTDGTTHQKILMKTFMPPSKGGIFVLSEFLL